MSVRPAAIVAVWTGANLVLAAMLPAFHEFALAIVLYFAAAVPALLFAGALWRIHGRNPRPDERFTLYSGTDWIPPLAFGCAVIGVGLIFGVAVIAFGAVILAVSVTMLLRASRSPR
jgi:hypothetical protein